MNPGSFVGAAPCGRPLFHFRAIQQTTEASSGFNPIAIYNPSTCRKIILPQSNFGQIKNRA
jgi:hypothetical protein